MYFVNTIKGKNQILHHAGSSGPLRTVTSVTDAQLATQVAETMTRLESSANASCDLAQLTELTALMPAAVSSAVRVELERYAPGTERTWTFFGHWEDDGLTVEYELPGDVEDPRDDNGTWPEGLWAASASGVSVEQARDRAVAPYETEARGECSVCHGTRQSVPAGQSCGPTFPCWNCTDE